MNPSVLPKIPGVSFIRKLGEGATSTVWKGRYTATGQMVAVKILRSENCRSSEDVAKFREEAQIMATLDDPGIVKAYDFAETEGRWYFLMEYMDGYNYCDYLARKRHVREGDALLICESVASAMALAWNEHGIVHCDIKPENLMINSHGAVKLTDLGIAYRFRNLAVVTPSDQVSGTPAYISPEQVHGDVELDCRSDIYSLGATLYHLVSGRVLFPDLTDDDTMRAHVHPDAQAPDPRRWQTTLSPGFVQMLEAMLVKDRNARIGGWDEVKELAAAVEAGGEFEPRENTSPSSLALD